MQREKYFLIYFWAHDLSFLLIWSQLLKKYLMENIIFYAVVFFLSIKSCFIVASSNRSNFMPWKYASGFFIDLKKTFDKVDHETLC